MLPVARPKISRRVQLGTLLCMQDGCYSHTQRQYRQASKGRCQRCLPTPHASVTQSSLKASVQDTRCGRCHKGKITRHHTMHTQVQQACRAGGAGATHSSLPLTHLSNQPGRQSRTSTSQNCCPATALEPWQPAGSTDVHNPAGRHQAARAHGPPMCNREQDARVVSAQPHHRLAKKLCSPCAIKGQCCKHTTRDSTHRTPSGLA